MFPLQNIRMNSLFGARPNAPQPNTNYPILNDFFTKILPLLKQGELAERNRGRINSTQNQMFPRQLPMQQPQDNEVIDLTGAMPKMQPVSTQWGGMSPYQEALIKLREQELGLNREKLASTTDINQQKVDIARFKSENPSARIVDNKQGKLLAINPITGEVVGEWDSGSMSEEEKVRLTQAGRLEQIAASGRNRSEQIEQQGDITSRQIQERGDITSRQIGERGDITSRQIAERAEESRKTAEVRHQLERELIALRGDQSIRGIERRGEIEKDLITLREQEQRITNADKPTSTSGSTIKTQAQVKYNKVINQHPEWRAFISLDDSGFPVVAEVGADAKGIGTGSLTKEVRDQILKALGITEETVSTDTKPEPKKDPLGIRK